MTSVGTNLQLFIKKLSIRLAGLLTDWRTIRLANQVAHHSGVDGHKKPIIIFNASTRLNTLSLNAGFALLASYAIRLSGRQVIHFICQAGMSRCVLGTDQNDFQAEPPCQACVRQSRVDTWAARTHPFIYQEDPALVNLLHGLNLKNLVEFTYSFYGKDLPLGALVLPSIRWRLRLHNLENNEATCFLMRQYLLSAWNVAREFSSLLEQIDPQAVLVFNGMFFPEAVVRWICKERGIFSVTHEVGLQPLHGFFTPGEATAYPISIPEDFQLDDNQNKRLDSYLENRLKGNFSMAGIRFWPEMIGLDQVFLEKAARFKQIVPVFSNVIFDTSQPHSNIVFEDMFAWLDLIQDLVRQHPETLFVLRAHPDEKRPGKESQQNVSNWVQKNGLLDLDNLVFVDSLELISSYELIERSKFIMIYNSTIGLEAAILGKAVLCGGRSRFTSIPTVFFPGSPEAYRLQAEEFLRSDQIQVPREFAENARRFLYFQLYKSSLPFDEFLEPSRVPGVVQLKPIHWQSIRDAEVLKVLISGLVDQTPFLFTRD